jgi:hypothetical protein
VQIEIVATSSLKQVLILREKETSAARYSNTAAKYTGAPAPTLVEYFPAFKNLAILPTGNCSPALVDRDMAFFPELFPLPDMVTDTRNFVFSPKPQCTGGEEWGTKICATTPMKMATKKHDLKDFRNDTDPKQNQGRRKTVSARATI